ncbi:VanZ family protein [Microbacterium enclense]|uniref:VanZ family protein n=1 Tax=Microbacterium enclense TaxID=993073 RepID=UPI0036DA38E7
MSLTPRTRRRLIWAVLAVYGVGLAFAVLWPEHIDKDAGAAYSWLQRLVPVATYARVEFALNIVLFVPLGALLAALLRRRRLAVVGLGWAVSLTIEIIQGTLLPGRTSSALDVAANTLGAALGVLGVVAAERLARRRDGAPRVAVPVHGAPTSRG